MKRAKAIVTQFAVECPHCEEECQDPIYGSYSWLIDEAVIDKTYRCDDCGREFQLPKQLKNTKLWQKRDWTEKYLGSLK